MSMLPNAAIFKRLSSQEDLNNDELTFEEKHKDAIYNVTYRKIYNQQQQLQLQLQQLQHQAITNGLVYSKIKIKQIKYGTIEKLIDCFTNDNGELDSNTTNTFLATYRTFTDIKNVLDIIFKKYSKIFPASLDMTEETRISHLKSFRSIITTWLDSYSEDFNEPPGFLNIRYLEKFCIKFIPESIELINFIRQKYELFKVESKRDKNNDNLNLKPPIISSSKSELNLANIGSQTTTSSSSSKTTTTTKTHYRSASNTGSITNLDQIDSKYLNNHHNYKYKKCPIDLKTNFINVDEMYIAEQLTYIDKELFQKVIPYHCLGAIWSSRKKPTNISKFETISAFIDQFNIVTFIVQGTVLEKTHDFNLTSSQRARIIEKWIRIALYCRNYKNFSSLNAIVQGLDTQCVSRLEKTWNEVSPECKLQFNELIELFSQENNQQLFRETLMRDLQEYERRFNSSNDDSSLTCNKNTNNKNSNLYTNDLFNTLLWEGTAKYADINVGINATLSRKAKERLMKQRLTICEPLGTVPFLGTFLRDLEYIHAQNPTKTDDGLINFAKKRKEFEIIAQIKLLQRAAQFYKIEPDVNFKAWLKSLPSFSEDINYDLSYQIEPRVEREQLVQSISNCSSNTNNSSSSNKKKSSLSRSSRCESLESVNSGNNNDLILKQQQQQQQQNSNNNNNNSNNSTNIIHKNQRHSRTSSNTSNSDIYINNSIGSGSINGVSVNSEATSNNSNNKALLVVKVNIETLNDHHNNNDNNNTLTPSTVCYKKIKVKDSDRTKDIKRLILEKFLMNPDKADKYSLFQVFNDGTADIFIKDNCNVYYAVKNVNEIQFLLRPKEPQLNNDINNNNNNNFNLYNSNNYSPSLLQTIVSPKINKKKYQQQQSQQLATQTLGRSSSSSSSRNVYNKNSLLPPPSPNYNHSQSEEPNQTRGWQLFRNIMS